MLWERDSVRHHAAKFTSDVRGLKQGKHAFCVCSDSCALCSFSCTVSVSSKQKSALRLSNRCFTLTFLPSRVFNKHCWRQISQFPLVLPWFTVLVYFSSKQQCNSSLIKFCTNSFALPAAPLKTATFIHEPPFNMKICELWLEMPSLPQKCWLEDRLNNNKYISLIQGSQRPQRNLRPTPAAKRGRQRTKRASQREPWRREPATATRVQKPPPLKRKTPRLASQQRGPAGREQPTESGSGLRVNCQAVGRAAALWRLQILHSVISVVKAYEEHSDGLDV